MTTGLPKWSALTVALAFAVLLPSAASAQEQPQQPGSGDEETQIDCTREYMACIKEASKLPEPFESLGYLECGAAYFGCVSKKSGLVA